MELILVLASIIPFYLYVLIYICSKKFCSLRFNFYIRVIG
ncbi:hypothetical protein CLPUN_30700 [Clostridium puniceum]|uniref:Uncharacterized protein n=1 Tax=Clostridium puniceum TaxID=29367 RepID=A0A1S8TE88_9CLOT|nr:hypothetical protein CLPUN_30700 [Clostridium puniceum]